MLDCDSHNNLLPRLIVVLDCYVDESADQLGNHTVLMAGYVADAETWVRFTHDWNEELKKRNWEFAHFTGKIFNRKGATKNAEAFYRIIEKHLDKAVCVTCKVPEYRKLMSRIQFPSSLTKAPKYVLLNDPHLFLYRSFIEACYWERGKLGIQEPVDLIFDESNKYKDIVSNMFRYLYHSAEALGIDTKQFGKNPRFEDDEKTPALQAADFLALIIRHNLVNGKPSTDMPWPKKKNVNHLIVDMGPDHVLQILDSSFSKENLEIYDKYAKQRHYWFYDLLYCFLKCLPRFIRVPILRILNKPFLLG